jgi:hypothetical protein
VVEQQQHAVGLVDLAPRQPSNARETRSCAAQISAIALSPSFSASRVLSTTSVNSKALIALISQWADAAPRTGEASSWHRVYPSPSGCTGEAAPAAARMSYALTSPDRS